MTLDDLYVEVVELHAWVREYNGVDDEAPAES